MTLQEALAVIVAIHTRYDNANGSVTVGVGAVPQGDQRDRYVKAWFTVRDAIDDTPATQNHDDDQIVYTHAT